MANNRKRSRRAPANLSPETLAAQAKVRHCVEPRGRGPHSSADILAALGQADGFENRLRLGKTLQHMPEVTKTFEGSEARYTFSFSNDPSPDTVNQVFSRLWAEFPTLSESK